MAEKVRSEPVDWHALETFYRNPSLFGEIYVHQISEPPKLSIDGRKALRLVEYLFDKDGEYVQIIPVKDRRGSAKELENAVFEAGKQPITQTEESQVYDLLQSTETFISRTGLQLKDSIVYTECTRFEDSVAPFGVKARPHFITKDGTIVFIHLVSDVASFPSAVWAARYDRKAALTSWAVSGTLSRPEARVCFLVIDDSVVGGRCALYYIDGDELQLAHAENMQLLSALRQSFEKSVFMWYAPEAIKLRRPHHLPLNTGVSQQGLHLWNG
jgi:hypothetical protein